MDDHKFCFIVCVSDERAYEECAFYISHLRIPNGYTAEMVPVKFPASMAAGYNKAMRATDARYKIFLRQDCFILNRNLLNDVLKIFSTDDNIGMIGVLGVPKASPDGVADNAAQVGNIYVPELLREHYEKYEYSTSDGLYDVDYLNGMMIITDRDLPWREDLFDGWDFYDASQGMEFKKKGYRVVVPEQRLAWCLYDEETVTRWSFDRYRRIFINEYLV